ncbi:MAG: ribosomal protein S18-alanine N-acetyltransferase [Lachnospiraceae bacterium]|nr:ribosomal protein S18-alanine N-acetyltransferase [Lachnospiraceae bacterium]MBR5738638.1 ribosomal protein S18-alanine N-acetyltransferase [Lachnospiraceae bacterium]
MNRKIRPMKTEDLPAVSAIESASFSMPWSEEEIERSFRLANYRFFVAEEDGEVVGYAGILRCLNEADLATVAVLERFRQRGIGAALMKAVLDYAAEEDLECLFLEVRESNFPARSLYEKVGFLPVGRRKDYYEHPREDAILMKYERRLVC